MTLIKLITDTTRKPTVGSIARHAQLKLGYYSQHAVEDLQAFHDPKSTSLSLMLQDAVGALTTGEVRGLLASLGLPGRIASDVPITKLSGGQLVRLALARTIWNRPNLLVLDEITPHLDHFTISALVDALKDYDGALLLVSRDRYLIRSVVQRLQTEEDDEDVDDDDDDSSSNQRTVYVMRNGRLRPLEGGVEEFEASLEKKLQTLAL
jgi:ATPase subunit of ABC transporter with duplicated ATPase domains